MHTLVYFFLATPGAIFHTLCILVYSSYSRFSGVQALPVCGVSSTHKQAQIAALSGTVEGSWFSGFLCYTGKAKMPSGATNTEGCDKLKVTQSVK